MQALDRDYEQLPILGHIIWYGLTGIKTDRMTLLTLLKQHGFQGYAPEPPTDKLALQRALRDGSGCAAQRRATPAATRTKRLPRVPSSGRSTNGVRSTRE